MLLGPQLKSQLTQITSKSESLFKFIILPLTIYNVEKLWRLLVIIIALLNIRMILAFCMPFCCGLYRTMGCFYMPCSFQEFRIVS